MAKIHFRTLGCRLNQAEAERLAQGFRFAGHDVVEAAEQADILVVNSCTVTGPAGAKSRRATHPARAGQRVVVTGCHSQVRPQDFRSADLVVRNEDKANLVALTLERFGLDGYALGMDYHPSGRPSVYPLVLGHTRAFVKIQDGCNLQCTFCMTTIARGASHSRPADEIVREVGALSARGCREVVLTGVHAGSYLVDRQTDLGALIRRIMRETEIPRVRLSSLEPWNFKPHWLELWTEFGERMCRHLHMSVQSGSDGVLRRMARAYDTQTYVEKVELLRQHIPGLGVTTDIIVGFPGETEKEHRESLAVAERLAFSGAHIFTYSPRPGTVAATMPGPIDGDVKSRRFREMRAITERSALAFRNTLRGATIRVLWEEETPAGLTGLSDNYVRVVTDLGQAAPNQITATRIAGEQDGVLRGEVPP